MVNHVIYSLHAIYFTVAANSDGSFCNTSNDERELESDAALLTQRKTALVHDDDGEIAGFRVYRNKVLDTGRRTHRRGVGSLVACSRYCLDLPRCAGFVLHVAGGCFTFSEISATANGRSNGAHSTYVKRACEPEDTCSWLMHPSKSVPDTTVAGGSSWTENEVLIVMAKINAVATGTGLEQLRELLDCYVEGPDSSSSNPTRIPCIQILNRFEGFGVNPSYRMLLRFGFHTCMKNKDGTGGCNGCINLAGVFDRWHVGANSRPSAGQPGGVRANGGLQLLLDALEEIYVDPRFPVLAPELDQSLQETGKSRADLWALAALVGANQLIQRNNQLCEAGEGLYNTMQSGVKCKIELSQHLRFFTGRRDCSFKNRPVKQACPVQCYRSFGQLSVDVRGCRPGFYECSMDNTCTLEECKDCRWCKPRVDGSHWPRAYESFKEEDAPEQFFTGGMTAEYFKRTFNFSKREAIAILGAHSAAEWHPQVNGGIPYDGVHKQADTLNNVYYRIISDKKSNHFERGRFPAASVGGVGHGDSREMADRRLELAASTREPDAPQSWVSGYLRCPFCLDGMNADRHQNIWGVPVTRCCELCPKASHAEVIRTDRGKHVYEIDGLNESERDDFTKHQCLKYVNVHENVLQSDVSLFWNITVPNNFYRPESYAMGARGKIATCTCPDGTSFVVGGSGRKCTDSTQFACEGGILTDTCRGSTRGEKKGMAVTCGAHGYATMGSEPNDGSRPSITTLASGPKNELRDPGDSLRMHEIVSLFADDQDVWANEFVSSLEKMLTNGVDSGLTQSFEIGPDIECKKDRRGWRCVRVSKASCSGFNGGRNGFTCPFGYAEVAKKAAVVCGGLECTLEECCISDPSQKLIPVKPPVDVPEGFVFLGSGICLTSFNPPHHFNLHERGSLAKCTESCKESGDACWAFSWVRGSCGRFSRDSVLGDCGDGFRAGASGSGMSFGKISVTEAENKETLAEPLHGEEPELSESTLFG